MAAMEDALTELIAALRTDAGRVDDAFLSRLLRRHNRATHDGKRSVAKRRLLPFYLRVKRDDPKRWEAWQVDDATEAALLRLLRMKPRRTASGVATVTVITKPWPCSSDCLYCPCDVRMPKSYLHDEPACQRAERNYFDPYLQVRSRITALTEMGHITDKVELIVLGGTWSDYPEAYQVWFVHELFRALNEYDSCDAPRTWDGDWSEQRARRYARAGLTYDPDELRRRTEEAQRNVTEGTCTYNEAIAGMLRSDAWRSVEAWQRASFEELELQHRANETAAHRVVGLTIETRPDLIDDASARIMRRLGCTKIQMGIQSLDERILALNRRNVRVDQIARAFATLRRFGYKIQVHMMCNLLGATPEADRVDYARLVEDPRFLPDEVKLYPCSLVESSQLGRAFEAGSWVPYTQDELVSLLADDVLATPAYVRISRMIRDISSADIVAGNKKTNLRQMVEQSLGPHRNEVREIRMREVAGSDVDAAELRLDCVSYATTTTDERFLQWVGSQNRIAGFLRLSMPREGDVAMIREVHVYGRVAGLGLSESGGAQHVGLGRALVERACVLARDAGFVGIRVISSVGTRNYYRALGFEDDGLYQRREL